MQKKTQDACAYIRKFGRPALFITLTCNPRWPEITTALPPHYQPHERHDIVARVFNGKLKCMMDLITKKKNFWSSKYTKINTQYNEIHTMFHFRLLPICTL